jgi:hypothetical protein
VLHLGVLDLRSFEPSDRTRASNRHSNAGLVNTDQLEAAAGLVSTYLARGSPCKYISCLAYLGL